MQIQAGAPVAGDGPAPLNILITRGDRWKRRLRFRTSRAGVTPITYMVLTGYTGRSQARADEDGTLWATGALSFGSDATSHYVDLTFHEDETSLFSGDGVWDLELTSPSDGPFTWLGGSFTIEEDVTHDA